MNTNTIRVALLATFAAFAGCITTRATVAPDANLAQYRTFAFSSTGEGTLARTPTGATIREEITRNLAEKGIQPAPAGTTPDFYVAPQLVMREQVNVNYAGWGGWGWGGGGGWGWGWGGWGGPTMYQYTEGTLIVDFIDPRTHESFWRGTASTVINTPDNPSPKKMAKSVDKLLDKYPMELTASAPGPTRM
jgi:hypothetical protein